MTTIDQLLEAADKASPGPWHVSGEGIYRENGLCSIARIGNAMSSVAGVEEANATLMAGAPQLATEVKRLRGDNEILLAKVTELKKLESIDNLLNRRAILEALDRFRAALEAVKE